MKFLATFCCLYGLCQQVVAGEVYIPDSPDFVVVSWEASPATYISSDHISELFRMAKYPGNSANFALAQDLLRQYELSSTDMPKHEATFNETEFLYQKAVVAQYFHNFEESNTLLDSVIKRQPDHTNAILLKSNMLLLLGKHEQALQMCTHLIGLAQQAIVIACANYAKAQQGIVKENLDSLRGFIKTQKITDLEVSIWLAEIQASLAKEAGDFTLAESILSEYENNRAPLSYWVLWSDIQLALNAPENVLATLGKITKTIKNKDDALLLRLAIAEKKMQLSHKIWQPQASARNTLREQRQDTEHAYDIALYYLYIKDDAIAAHKWAKINWQQAKLIEDANLLSLTEVAIKPLRESF